MKVKLTEKNLALMNEAQRQIVLTQWKKHQHETHEVDFDVTGEGDFLKGFIVEKNVWDPFLASGRFHARYLFYNNHLFYERTVIEIGSGTGLMSVIMAKYGAKKVIANDISPFAVENTIKNAEKLGFAEKIKTIQGDLFVNIHEKADTITWMIPFFPGNPPERDTISASMIMPPELFERFLKEAKNYLNKGGVLVIPSYSLGGDLTNPIKYAEKFGYDIKTTWTYNNSVNGIQRGFLYVHELRLKE